MMTEVTGIKVLVPLELHDHKMQVTLLLSQNLKALLIQKLTNHVATLCLAKKQNQCCENIIYLLNKKG